MTLRPDLKEFITDHRPHGPWPPMPRSPRGMAIGSPWRVLMGWCLDGGWRPWMQPKYATDAARIRSSCSTIRCS